MTLLAQIQADALAARKAKDTDKATSLITLLGEAVRVGKDAGNRDSTDVEVQAVVRKFISNNTFTIDKLAASTDPKHVAGRTAAQAENALLAAYLPAQATVAQLTAVIDAEVAKLSDPNPKYIGQIIRALNDQFGDDFDKAEASKLIKERLAKK